MSSNTHRQQSYSSEKENIQQQTWQQLQLEETSMQCSLLGVTELTIPKASTSSRNIRPTSYRRASSRRCSKQSRSRPLDTTQQGSTLPTHQCLSRTSSCPVQATHTTGSWPRNMETTTQALFNSPWYTQCRVPYKTVETTVQRKQV